MNAPADGTTKARSDEESRGSVGDSSWLRAFVVGIISTITLVAFAVRLDQLGAQSLWLDEAMSVVLASRPLPELLRLLAAEDIHPPLYPAALHLWMAVAGNGEFAARFPSLFSGVALVPLVYATGKRLELLAAPRSRSPLSLVGAAGAALATYSGFYLSYSQEARGYMPLTLLGLLSCYLLLRALPGSGWRIWAAYTVATVAALYTHYAAFLLVVFQLLFVVVVARSYPRAWVRWPLSALAVGILYLPWLRLSLDQVERLADHRAGPLQLDAALRTTLLQLMVGTEGDSRRMLMPTLLGIGLLALGLIALLGGGRRRPAQHSLFLLLYLVVPPSLLYAVTSYLPEFDPRYLLVATPAFYLTLAWGVSALLGTALSRAAPLTDRVVLPALGLAAVAALVAVSAVYGEPARTKPDYRSLVAYLEANSRPGDAVVLMRNAPQPYQYYSRLSIPRYSLEPFDDFEGAILRMNRWAAEHRRLWFILWQRELVDPADYALHVLEDQARELSLERSFAGLELRLFEPAAGSGFSYYPAVANRTEAIFGRELEFWGWNLSSSEASGGQYVEFDLHWIPMRAIQRELKVVLELVDRDRHVWARTDELMATPLYPSGRWKEKTLVHDRHRLAMPAGMPPGEYRAELRVYDAATREELAITRWSGAEMEAALSLGRIAIKPTPWESLAGLPFRGETQQPAALSLAGIRALLGLGKPALSAAPAPLARWELGGDRVELLNGRLTHSVARPGQVAEVTLLWRSPAVPRAEYLARVALLNPRGNPMAEQTMPIVSGYPMARWNEGEGVLGKYWLPLPVTLDQGRYQVAVAVGYAEEKGVPSLRYAHVANLDVLDLVRGYKLPPMQYPVGARLGGKVELAGFDLGPRTARPGDTLQLTLYWRTLGALDRSYKVFNHVIDERNLFAGQRDAVPVRDTRPTNTWREGEVLIDSYEIPIFREARPGRYLLKVGLYAQEGGERLPVIGPNGDPVADSITLATIEVRP